MIPLLFVEQHNLYQYVFLYVTCTRQMCDSAFDCERFANLLQSNRPSIFGPLNSIRSTRPAFKSDGISSCKLNPILALPEAWLWSLGPPLWANTWPRVHTNSGQGLWPTTWKQSRGKRENGGIWNKVSGLARSHRLEKYLVIVQNPN